jgi:hypothetical protein
MRNGDSDEVKAEHVPWLNYVKYHDSDVSSTENPLPDVTARTSVTRAAAVYGDIQRRYS